MYSQFLRRILCLVKHRERCKHAVTLQGQVYCLHPNAMEIAKPAKQKPSVTPSVSAKTA